jgi:hypothetical protein
MARLGRHDLPKECPVVEVKQLTDRMLHTAISDRLTLRSVTISPRTLAR